MKAALFVLALGLVVLDKPVPVLCVMAQSKVMAQVVEPPELPPGHFCKTAADVKGQNDHPCGCHRECVDDHSENPDGSQTTTTRVKEDPQCTQYCHASHCACPVKNCD